MPPSPKEQSATEDKVGILPSHGIAVDVPSSRESRPAPLRHVSSPSYESPLRHHVRKQSSAREVKETLHARSEYTNSQDDGGAIHRINQYVIKEELGRGSFGAVHLAVDQHGVEYAVKEFSKARLRKRAQSNILRRPHAARRAGHIAAGMGFNSPLHRHSSADIQDQEEGGNPLYLIKEEIAIMKKLNHVNLVSLIEVLDDPSEDSLYMVLEMCKKGVVMKVGMDEKADPYDEESCRCWFRDLVLGIEYLHAQGVVHRDIKPDNLLLTNDDILKIVDFGVSEMFEKQSEMLTAKSAGSPAFLPPELCVAKHGDISGKAADIWSMGITLYCLRFGKIPFEKAGVLDLYEAIKNDTVDLDAENTVGDDFRDLMHKLLEKDPQARIRMHDLRAHPWVTKNGKDPLLSEEENTANLVEPPTEEETDQAITGNLGNVLSLMKAAKRFKNAIAHKRPPVMNSILGQDARIVQPPASMSLQAKPPLRHKTKSEDVYDRATAEKALVAEGVHRDIEVESVTSDPNAVQTPTESPKAKVSRTDSDERDPSSPVSAKRDLKAHPEDHRSSHNDPESRPTDHVGKGQAHDPLSEHLYLALGTGYSSRAPSPPVVSESPPAADGNIYEAAYGREIQRLRSIPGRSTTLFLTRRVEDKEEYRLDEDLIRGTQNGEPASKGGFANLLQKARTAKNGPKHDEAHDGAHDETNDETSAEPEGKATGNEPARTTTGSVSGIVKSLFNK